LHLPDGDLADCELGIRTVDERVVVDGDPEGKRHGGEALPWVELAGRLDLDKDHCSAVTKDGRLVGGLKRDCELKDAALECDAVKGLGWSKLVTAGSGAIKPQGDVDRAGKRASLSVDQSPGVSKVCGFGRQGDKESEEADAPCGALECCCLHRFGFLTSH
jgi:hypothetical protein